MSANSTLILSNISKRNNLQQLLQVGEAYGFHIILVGMKKILEQIDASSYMIMEDLDQVKSYLHDRGVVLVGIEITDSAISLSKFSFPPCFALMPGNEGTGLNEKQREICDIYVYIPQFGDGIESLNVTVATTVVMNEYVASLSAISSISSTI